MADLNKMLKGVQDLSRQARSGFQDLLVQYEDLYREANQQLLSERNASGTMNGLDDFYRLVNVIRRNRDVVGSLVRGLHNIRPMEHFKFVIEDTEPKPEPKKKKVKKAAPIPEPVPSLESAPEETTGS